MNVVISFISRPSVHRSIGRSGPKPKMPTHIVFRFQITTDICIFMFGYIEIHIIMPFLVYTFRMNTSRAPAHVRSSSRSNCSVSSSTFFNSLCAARVSDSDGDRSRSGQCDFSLVHRNYRKSHLCSALSQRVHRRIDCIRDQCPLNERVLLSQ